MHTPLTTETIQKITNAQPDPIARFNYAAPPELERIVRKLLEKDPSRRYQSARELYVDLKNRPGWGQFLAQKLNIMIVSIPDWCLQYSLR